MRMKQASSIWSLTNRKTASVQASTYPADIQNLQISECKEPNPSITFDYTATSNQYGHKTGNRLFIPTNVFEKNSVFLL